MYFNMYKMVTTGDNGSLSSTYLLAQTPSFYSKAEVLAILSCLRDVRVAHIVLDNHEAR